MGEKDSSKTGAKKKISVIDPVYLKFTKSVIRAIGSTDFYEYFMDTISHAENEIQFSNRRMEKWIDRSWVHAIEDSLEVMAMLEAADKSALSLRPEAVFPDNC